MFGLVFSALENRWPCFLYCHCNSKAPGLNWFLITSGALDVPFAEKDSWIASILWICYLGEAGAKALAKIIVRDFNQVVK